MNSQFGWTQVDAVNMHGQRPPIAEKPQPPLFPLPGGDDNMKDMVLAMAYEKKQEFGQPYETETGFERGTIFPELDLPFMGEGGCYHDE